MRILSFWIQLIPLVLAVAAQAYNGSVPAILFSYNLSPGMIRHQQNYESSSVLPNKKFKTIATELLEHCNSDAYIFVNQPGLKVSDFTSHSESWPSLSGYIRGCSTALKFEKIEVNGEDHFEDFIKYIKNNCDVNREVRLSGLNPDKFQTYIDINKRAIRIDFPPLPAEDSLPTILRDEAIKERDLFLRKVLAQIPSPRQTLIFTSLKSLENKSTEEDTPSDIFPQIFNHESRDEEYERNSRTIDVKPYFPTPRPKFQLPDDSHISVFDPKFLEDNRNILRLIILAVIGSITLQVYSMVSPSFRISSSSSKPTTVNKTAAVQPALHIKTPHPPEKHKTRIDG
ncbi:Big1p Ecym_5503 [Eremothecium cymbalariae DBVPG|uniref:Protein BIG1 n=1 Tax=Eremothecium cymbalariae (strain CBS 270.75 / DBVPG 7215 / KCTC 17166 / NRRL Y-17582) TaxID=931890 RepID=I6NDV4_ERECY|nr:hypothetical protein Ecym_5503 [Eremothecium cymbalariae DBVPG\